MDEKELDKMAKDIEPIAEPKEPEVSTGFVEDRETYVKPDGETTASPERTPNVIKEGSGKGKWIFGGLATILILGLGGATAWAYTDAQSVRNELQSMKTGLDVAKTDAAKLRDEVQSLKAKAMDNAATEEVVEKTDKELVADTVTATLHAPVENKSAKVAVNVMKNSKEFAYASAGFEEGGGAAYILKKVDGLWIIVFKGQDVVSDEIVKEFGIPTEYRTGQ